MRGRRFVVALLMVVVSVGIAVPALADSNCGDWTTNSGSYFRIRGQVRYNGAALSSVRGFAWNTWLYNAYINPGYYGGDVGSGMYIADAYETKAVWFGWIRHHDNPAGGGYATPQLRIIYGDGWTPDQGFYPNAEAEGDAFKAIPLASPTTPNGTNLQLRLKFFNDPKDGKWKFYWGYKSDGSDAKLVYTLTYSGLTKGFGYLHSGVGNTCSSARNIWNNTYRYSDTNKSWIAMGLYDTFLVRHDATNEHFKLSGGATAQDLSVSCNTAGGYSCRLYS